MKDYERIISSSLKDTKLLSGVAPEDLERKMFQDLSVLFSNKENLNSIIKCKTHIWEYCFVLKMKDTTWFMDGMSELLNIFHSALNREKTATINSIKHYYATVGNAIQSQMEAFYLEQSSKKLPPNLFVRASFREIGSILESGILPLLKQTFHLYTIAKKQNISPDEIDYLSFGKMINTMSEITILKNIYFPEPVGISISQWRNIAQHSNYNYLENEWSIMCKFGKESKVKQFKIPLNEYTDTLKNIHNIYALHKIAISFFTVDFIHLFKGLSEKRCVTNDSVAACILDALHVYGFKVKSFQYDTDDWSVFLFDRKARSQTNVQAILQEIARPIAFDAKIKFHYNITAMGREKPYHGTLKFLKRPIKRFT